MNLRLVTFARGLSSVFFTRELSLRICGMRAFVWDSSLDNSRLRYFAWHLLFGFVSPRDFRLSCSTQSGHVRLGIVAFQLSCGDVRL